MRKKILATSSHPGGINAIVPVIRKLNNDKKTDILAISADEEYSQKAFQNGKCEFKQMKDYNLPDYSPESMNMLMGVERPDIILTGTSVPEKEKNFMEQTAVFVAGKKKIPAVSVLDFWGDYSARFSGICSGEKMKFLPDKIAIMDKYAEKDMLNEGFPREKMIITGNPHFDSLEKMAKNFKEKDKSQIRKHIGLKNEMAVFYAGGLFKDDKIKWGYWDLDNIKIINDVLQGLDEESKSKIEIVIKLHPRTPKKDLGEITDYLENNAKSNRIVKDISSQEIILATDVTLTYYSTVGIEAVYLGKPVISIQPNLKTNDYMAVLTKNKISPVGYTEQECKSLIKKAILNKNYRKEIVENASSFRTDGKATERVANLIYEMLGIN